ncbi:hypothetical protein LH464_04160 [Neorhizobium sp. T786]|uniref:hypothetical protein n=1 Tax=Pseudorhizobium xiangyangii TaxID=2883104 RepID=UPI001D000F23|nr:hypothetical protein [Neorhizobium xiangyangii]MCB5201671.1 hypothetical protein [Neorhizobium xiangyangii]
MTKLLDYVEEVATPEVAASIRRLRSGEAGTPGVKIIRHIAPRQPAEGGDA